MNGVGYRNLLDWSVEADLDAELIPLYTPFEPIPKLLCSSNMQASSDKNAQRLEHSLQMVEEQQDFEELDQASQMASASGGEYVLSV